LANAVEPIRAAGGVVWRARGSDPEHPEIEVALIHRPRYDDWSLPKGKLAPAETEIEGAVREVLEETGLRVRLGRPLGETRYMKPSSGNASRPKVVRYWAMRAEDGGTFSPNREVDELRWVSLGDARALLTHERDKDIIDRFVRGPQLAGIVLLVRHASAGSSSKWAGDDRLRPLDRAGWEQAEALVRFLSRFEIEQIVSADYVRCTQTVVPFAEAVGLSIKDEPVFSEAGYPGHEDAAVEMIRKFGSSGLSTVVCSQGDVIPDVLDRLAEEDHVDIPKAEPKKGSVSALTFDKDRLFAIEYFKPPRTESEPA
jgi:8-oxo-(d)GTP phosphatase